MSSIYRDSTIRPDLSEAQLAPRMAPKDFRSVRIIPVTWSPFTESNRRPSPYHGDALPTELTGPIVTCLTCGFTIIRQPVRAVHTDAIAFTWRGVEDDANTVSDGELSVLPPSWRLHQAVANLTLRTIRADHSACHTEQELVAGAHGPLADLGCWAEMPMMSAAAGFGSASARPA